jgi:hypothetical protein
MLSPGNSVWNLIKCISSFIRFFNGMLPPTIYLFLPCLLALWWDSCQPILRLAWQINFEGGDVGEDYFCPLNFSILRDGVQRDLLHRARDITNHCK